MRGVVVTGLKDYLESEGGINLWQELLTKADKEDLIVMSSEFYPDDFVVSMVVMAAELTETPVNEFIEQFGKHLFKTLDTFYHFMMDDIKDYDTLIHSLDNIIHPQVKKLHPDAIVPSFEVSNKDNGWHIEYRSERKLCPLAIGLLYGAAEHYNFPINIEHPHCVHSGHPCCEFEVNCV